jgi:hypothetical protein
MNAIVKTLEDLAIDKATIRQKILSLQAAIARQPGAMNSETAPCPVNHHFADGMYCREIILPKGMLVVGKIHKHAHPNFIMRGDVTFVTEEGIFRVQGPCSMVSPAGTKRVVYAHEETVWITVHKTDSTDLEEIEEQVIAKDYAELEAFLANEQKEQLCLG